MKSRDDLTIEEKVQVKLADLVYDYLGYGQLAEFITFSIVTAILWQKEHKLILLVWYIISVSFCGLRYVLIHLYRKSYSMHSQTLKKWLNLLALSAFIAGISWSPLGTFLLPETNSVAQSFIIITLLGAICAANIFYSPVKFVYFYFLIPAFVPHILTLILLGRDYYPLALEGIIYLGLMLILSISIHRLLAESVRLNLENIDLRHKLYLQTIHDPLTGLFNRRFLDEMLKKDLAKASRDKSNLVVAMLDLDYFKQINDNYGHEAGDEVLRQAGKLLNHYFRKSDTVCRYGGEEFVVILQNMNLENAIQKLDSFRLEFKSKTIKFKQ